MLPAAIAVAAFAVLRWRDFGPAGTARPAPRKRHPPVGPGTGRDIDPFLSNAAAWLSAHRPSVITLEECLIIWALPELGHTTYACKTNPARPERANRASPAGSSQWNGITQSMFPRAGLDDTQRKTVLDFLEKNAKDAIVP